MHKLKTSAKANLTLLAWAIKLNPRKENSLFLLGNYWKVEHGGAFFYPVWGWLGGFYKSLCLGLFSLPKEKPKKERETKKTSQIYQPIPSQKPILVGQVKPSKPPAQTNAKKFYMNFWNQLESKQITDREQIATYLTQKLGQPSTETQTHLLSELTKKINSYYHEPHPERYTTYSLIGSVQEIAERIRKTGKRKGQLDYDLKLANQETLQARKEDLAPEKWNQITKLALLGQNLVFKYRKWITNKQLLDFYPQPKTK